MATDIFESSFTDRATLEGLNTEEYFHKNAPRTWDFGRFSAFCNELSGFPQRNRSPCARFLWDHNLEKLTTCNDSKMRDRAMRLLNIAGDVNNNSTNNSTNVPGNQSRIESIREPPTHASKSSSKSVREPSIHTNKASSGPTRELATRVDPKPSPVSINQPPHESAEPAHEPPGDHEPKAKPKRKSLLVEAPGYDAERSASPSPGPAAQVPPPQIRPPLKKFRSSLPRPPSKRPSSDDQSGRQKLIHLRETVMRDIRSTVVELGDLAAEAKRVHESYARLCSKLDSKLEEIINDPQIRASDTMLTDKDDDGNDGDSDADTVPLSGRA